MRGVIRLEIQKVLQYLQKNYEKDIPLDLLAQWAGLSKFYFARTFKRVTGLTYKTYLARIRVSKAKEMLEKEDLSITEISRAVGYKDLTHFERVFQRFVGKTPSAYRKSIAPKTWWPNPTTLPRRQEMPKKKQYYPSIFGW